MDISISDSVASNRYKENLGTEHEQWRGYNCYTRITYVINIILGMAFLFWKPGPGSDLLGLLFSVYNCRYIFNACRMHMNFQSFSSLQEKARWSIHCLQIRKLRGSIQSCTQSTLWIEPSLHEPKGRWQPPWHFPPPSVQALYKTVTFLFS